MVDYVFPVCNYPDVRIATGSGSYVTDEKGRQYLDLNSGQFCAVAGHSSDVLEGALNAAMGSIQDTHTGLLSSQAFDGLKALGEISGFEKPYSILLSTGSEASEFALRYSKHIKSKDGVIAFDVGYHGITHGAAGYSMSRARVRPPLVGAFEVPAPQNKNFADSEKYDYSDEMEALKQCLSENADRIASFIVEPIISGGGMYKVPDGYLAKAIELCHQHDVHVIFDECQTGMGRLGNWFSYVGKDILPDFVIAGKSLGLGFPVSSVTARGESVELDRVILNHFSSHQNEAFSGLIVSRCINWIRESKRLDYIRELSEVFLDLLNHHEDGIIAPRGEGFMFAFDLTDAPPSAETIRKGNDFVSSGLKFGLLLQHCNYGRTIRILPNYNATVDEFCEFNKKLEGVLNETR